MSDKSFQSPNPLDAYAEAYAMGIDLRQKFGSQNLELLKRDHVDRAYRDNVHYAQIVNGFTRGYEFAETARDVSDAGGLRS